MRIRRRYSFREYLNPRVLTMTALGFSSGLPFLLVGNTFGLLAARRRHHAEGDRHSSPGSVSPIRCNLPGRRLLDRVPALKMLGQRRGWMLLSQIIIAAGLLAMAFVGTQHGLAVLGACALAGGICVRHPRHRHLRLAN